MKNKKGFTLIELLAVIVILAVLLGIAIPAVAKYINISKKNTFISNAQSYAKAARSEAMIGTYNLPINNNEATVISFKKLESALENGGITSSYGGTFDVNYSYVVIVNAGTAEAPQYKYYIAAIDSKGYGIGVKSGSTVTAKAIEYDAIKEENIVQIGLDNDNKPTGLAITTATATGGDLAGVTITTNEME